MLWPLKLLTRKERKKATQDARASGTNCVGYAGGNASGGFQDSHWCLVCRSILSRGEQDARRRSFQRSG